jgi:multiple sugar transport system ATP-binding protein
MAEISIEHIKKNFGSEQVINDLTIEIKNGEFFTFVGPSGCGKSTILNMIAGLEAITEGIIKFDGMAVNELSPKKRDVAMVFQSYALYPHMTVYGNLAFPLKIKKTKKEVIDSEVKRISFLLGLDELLKRKPRELSGGQRQRVALGRAIIRKPRVFLMDEPLSNLDARLRVEMRTELKRLHNELKITTIYVTHDQAEAMSMSDRIGILSDGIIQQCGTPREIYLKPENTMVAGFVGSPSMNFIPALLKNRNPVEVDCNGLIISPLTDNPPENKGVILGIRPEDITVSSHKAEGGIEAVVSIIESAGPYNWIDIKWGDTLIKGVADIDDVLIPEDKCYITFSDDKVLLFDRETRRRI